ncbi:MAG: hypothetical protein K8R41_05505, partial [Bacteroidales bacterium]|nr:hypothetical protein [Bacteroidales bacterium]
MKTKYKIIRLIMLMPLLFWGYTGMCQKSVGDVETIYYGMEIDGVICGYTESSKKLINENGKEWLQVNDESIQKLTVLGQNVDITMSNNYKIDPETGRYFFCERNYSNGSITLQSTTKVEGDKAFFTSNI